MLSCFLSFDDEYEAKYKRLCRKHSAVEANDRMKALRRGYDRLGPVVKTKNNLENFKNLRWDFSQIIWEPWYLVVIDSDFNLAYLPLIARGGKVVWSFATKVMAGR